MLKEKDPTAEVVVSQFIEKFWRQLFTALVVVAVLYGGYLIYGVFAESREKAAQENLFAIQREADDITEKLWSAKDAEKAAAEKAAQDKKGAKKPPTPEAVAALEKTPETLVKHFSGVITRYEAFIAANKGKKASYMAAVQLAGLAVDYKDLPRAEKALSEVANVGSSDLFLGLVKTQLGTVLMDQKKFAEAAEQFQGVLDNKDQAYFHPQALLRLGVAHMETGDWSKADAAFARLEADHANTRAAAEAKSLKRLVALKKAAKGNS